MQGSTCLECIDLGKTYDIVPGIERNGGGAIVLGRTARSRGQDSGGDGAGITKQFSINIPCACVSIPCVPLSAHVPSTHVYVRRHAQSVK